MKLKNNIKYLIFLQVCLLFLSLSSVCSKIASTKEFLSFEFIKWMSLTFIILFIYAICWQQILKHLKLNVGYLNKPITIIWNILWGILLFNETINIYMIIGAIIIISGISLVVSSYE